MADFIRDTSTDFNVFFAANNITPIQIAGSPDDFYLEQSEKYLIFTSGHALEVLKICTEVEYQLNTATYYYETPELTDQVEKRTIVVLIELNELMSYTENHGLLGIWNKEAQTRLNIFENLDVFPQDEHTRYTKEAFAIVKNVAVLRYSSSASLISDIIQKVDELQLESVL